MSLINDALNRARAEAAQREALEHGEAIPPPHYAAQRRRRLPALLLVGVAALVILIGLNLWIVRAPASSPGPSVGDAEPTVQPIVETAMASAATEPLADPASIPTVEPPPPTTVVEPTAVAQETPPSPAVPQTTRAEPQEPGTAGPDSDETAPPDASPAPDAPRPAPVDTGSRYLLPGGDELRLQGIAWSASSPTAFVSGHLVGVGDRVLGFEIVEIGRRNVQLTSDTGQEVSLRLGRSGDN